MTESMDNQTDSNHLAGESGAASRETTVGSTPGSPTWPIVGESPPATPPPVGLNWGTVAERFGMDLRVLQHEGLIVLRGEYVPAAGYFIDPDTFVVQHVDVGGTAPRHGYFVGDTTASEFSEHLATNPPEAVMGLPVRRTEGGPIIGLFSSEQQAERARSAVMQGALGAGVRCEAGPLGIELRVERTALPGTIASLIAGQGGAVISVAGRPVAGSRDAGSAEEGSAL